MMYAVFARRHGAATFVALFENETDAQEYADEYVDGDYTDSIITPLADDVPVVLQALR